MASPFSRFMLLAAAAGIGYSKFVVPRRLALPAAVRGELREHSGRAGRIGCYVGGDGPPMLLVHSINAAASAYEVKPLFEHAAARFRVFAPDLPGFGCSDRAARRYEIALYVDAIHDTLELIERECGAQPVDVVALSLSSEFAARSAVQRPERVRSLALVTPTGFSRSSAKARTSEREDREIPAVHRVLSFGLWSQALYDALVSKRSIRYFLQRTYGSRQVDEAMVEYDYLSAHQPGARHAPLAFLSGRLFSADIRSVYEQLAMPVWLAHGTRGDFRDFSDAGWVRDRANWSVRAFDTGALPHFERRTEFMTAFDEFLAARY